MEKSPHRLDIQSPSAQMAGIKTKGSRWIKCDLAQPANIEEERIYVDKWPRLQIWLEAVAAGIWRTARRRLSSTPTRHTRRSNVCDKLKYTGYVCTMFEQQLNYVGHGLLICHSGTNASSLKIDWKESNDWSDQMTRLDGELLIVVCGIFGFVAGRYLFLNGLCTESVSINGFEATPPTLSPLGF